MPDIEFEFQAIVSDVRERFQKRYDAKKVGSAKTDAQMADAGEDVSIGWYVSLAQYGIAIYFGKNKPDIERGDTLCLISRKIPKEPPPQAGHCASSGPAARRSFFAARRLP